MTICRSPFIKNREKYDEFAKKSVQKNFTNENEFNELIDEAFFNKPEDFILAFNVAEDVNDAFANMTRFPIEPPYVRIALLDYIYNGFCAVISYSNVVEYLVKTGEIQSADNDITWYHMTYLNVILLNRIEFRLSIISKTFLEQEWRFLFL